jgi:hypothetical protein
VNLGEAVEVTLASQQKVAYQMLRYTANPRQFMSAVKAQTHGDGAADCIQ